MTDLPHVIAGQLGISEEHTRAVEAWWREHNDGPPPLRWTASMYNAAVDWANALPPLTVEEEAPIPWADVLNVYSRMLPTLETREGNTP